MAGNNSIRLLRGDDLNTKTNVLLKGQPAFDIKNNKLYVGDGITALNNLSSINSEENNKNYYNLGAFDTYTSNNDTTGNIRRNTYILNLSKTIGKWVWQSGPNRWICQIEYPKPNWTDFKIGRQNKRTYNVFINSSGDLLVINEIDNNINILNDFLQDLVTQYEVSTEYQYTENVIENQPIHIANQEENLYWHSEWRKGLNLCKNSQKLVEGWNTVAEAGELPIGTYTAIFTKTTEGGCHFVGGGITQSENIIAPPNEPITFTTKDTSRLQVYVSGASGVNSFMLVKGTHPYPYEPYNGPIIHQKELDDNLNNYLPKSSILQTTGQSTTEPMSQKATTDAINNSIASAITTTLNTAV